MMNAWRLRPFSIMNLSTLSSTLLTIQQTHHHAALIDTYDTTQTDQPVDAALELAMAISMVSTSSGVWVDVL